MRVKKTKIRFDRRFKKLTTMPFDSTLVFLKKNFPLLYSVEILPITEPNPRGQKFLYGECSLIKEKRKKPVFKIRIAEGLPEDLGVYTLLHEWAHALAWPSTPKPGNDHSAEWGVAYSRIESAFVGEKYG